MNIIKKIYVDCILVGLIEIYSYFEMIGFFIKYKKKILNLKKEKVV
jgi:hypothetical protein